MIREEHIYQLKQYLQGKSISMCPSSSLYWQEHWEEVIKALEQEPVLNKIIAEIESCEDKIRSSGDYDKAEYVAYNDAIIDILQIIDKYKKESEE